MSAVDVPGARARRRRAKLPRWLAAVVAFLAILGPGLVRRTPATTQVAVDQPDKYCLPRVPAPPIAEPLRPILLGGFMRQGRRENGAVSAVSVTSGKIAERARTRWAAAGLEAITLHECRHTYASFLMAAGYTLRELMEYMGHSSLQATERYVKLLPPLDETDPAERLNAYLRRRAGST
ncbi:MAG TPA: tyrosine-type recombinase/integrase [Solirubrobacteraceae bacterium]|nr:tyrosine-type recombinase/integrase [Solirubrobacteraceae bacterium]